MLLTIAAFCNAQQLAPGSKAPALSVKTWYKGTPIKAFDKNKTYVVEFWATWCGPCRESIPHLTELAKKNKKVTFVGVSIWEDDKGGNIKKFVAEMGKKMAYNVGYSGNRTGMAHTWMEAAAQTGIPTAFVVKNQTIQWIGHPMELAKPLAQVQSGKFDLKAAKKSFDKQAAAQRAQMAAQGKLVGIGMLIKEGKLDEASKQLDELEKGSAEMKQMTGGMRLTLLAKKDPAAWEEKAKAMAAGTDQDKSALAVYALEQADSKGDTEHAQFAIDQLLANATESDLLTFCNAAYYYDISNNPAKAVECIDKAIAALPKSQFKDNKEVGKQLKDMRTQFAAKIKG